MSAADLHTLTGAYALGGLPAPEAAEFARHLERCEACALEVRELRETAARLALAVAEVPPTALRDRVMAALPQVRQLPPEPAPVAASPAERGSRRRRLPQLALAACLVFAVAAGGIAVRAWQQEDKARSAGVQAQRQAADLAALLTAPDASYRRTALKAGGSGTVVVSRTLGRAAFVYHGLPKLPDRRVYELWYSRGGTMVPAGLVTTGSSSGTLLLSGGPAGAAGVGVTAEPAGGSAKPTSAPLALLPI
jgi:anti-sigma-K factor RskA